ncbi:FIMAH domain-containing protein [Aquisalibacillus elongatus]|uniref:Carbohydrate binding protein n=1 Tax=Aquisalibacillus elongatus TaxID=485577 RepID=A0A3N5BA98_9BACI|nr:carbohydrate binding domain-containing protein [Aquisalibacillus elongatus]RPF54333.1 carbohydrate binding protein [Aquisalibacillus elongatus]
MFKNKSSIWLIPVTILTLVLTTLSTPLLSQANNTNINETTYGGKEFIDTPLNDVVSIFDGAVGKEDGRDVMYATSKGMPARLSVLDINNDELLRVIDLKGAESTWAHEVTVDNDLYIATIGGGAKLWKYTPGSESATIVARFSGETFPYSITSDDEGNVYVGTYPSGKVFKYDPTNDEVTSYGQMNPEANQEYIRSIGYLDGKIYAGTGSDKIVEYDISQDTKTDIAEPLDETGIVYDLEVVDDRYIFTRYGDSSNMYIYDAQNQEWLDIVIPDVRGLHVEEESLNNEVYFMNTQDQFKKVNLETLEVTDTGMRYQSGLRGADWVELEDPDLPGKSLATINWSGSVVKFNIETEQVVSGDQIAAGTPTVTNEIAKGADGNFYISGVQSTNGAIFDPLSETFKSFEIGQADTMSKVGDKLYLGQYPGARIFEYDTNKDPSSSNPKELFQIGDQQDRVKTIVEGENQLFIGTISDYNTLGGALTEYNPNTGEKEVHRNVVENQSVVSLAYRDGLVYGSTSIHNGLGSDTVADEARVFVWDVNSGEKINETTLNVEGIDNPEVIGDLSFGPDGLLWGAYENVIFALDPETLEVIKSKKVYPDNSLYYSSWQTIELKWFNNKLYANFDRNLTVIDPDTLDSQKVTEAYAFDFSDSGDLYFSLPSNRTQLYKIETFSTDLTNYAINQYLNKGLIEKPLASTLSNSINQAKHHTEKGDLDQAEKHLNDYLKHLNNEDLDQFISQEVKKALQFKGDQLINILNNEFEMPGDSVAVPNQYFEEELIDGQIPGWSSDFEESDNYYHELSNEHSFDGEYSLKITDTVRDGSVAISSDPIEATPGREYNASAKVMLMDGNTSFMVRFYNEENQLIDSYPVYHNTSIGQWTDLEVSAVAPEDTSYLKIYAYTTRYQIGEAYYDSISLEEI